MAYYFGRELFDELEVPIGLLLACRGGIGIEVWSPYESLLQFEAVNAAEKRLAAEQEGLSSKGRAWRVCPGALYNAMIHPLIPYGMRGLVWYQGESNAHSVKEAVLYRSLLENMIVQWRGAWGVDFPVYAVQLPNYQTPTRDGESWPFIRESVLKVAQEVPEVWMVVTIDVGDPDDLHPKVKRPVGVRLARQALAHTYGQDIVSSGPLYRLMRKEGDRIVLKFDSVGSGLVAKDGPLKTFEISGADGHFFPAEAEIVRDAVIIRSAAVGNPVFVRYAWAPNPDGCNLFNREGFPASPFRTDHAGQE